MKVFFAGCVAALILGLLALSGCAIPPNPDMVADVNRIEAKIVRACTASGLFKPAIGMGAMALEAAFPVAVLPVTLVNAGVDVVCAHPSVFAGDVSTLEWVTKTLAARL